MCSLKVENKKIRDMLQFRRNKPVARKKPHNIPIAYCEKGLDEYFLACENSGITVPDLFFEDVN
jgi:hypothetical protein